MFDKNGVGFYSADDVKRVVAEHLESMTILGEEIPSFVTEADFVDTYMREVDTDGDGRVTFKEDRENRRRD